MSSYRYDYAVLIGRFQPFHSAHKKLAEIALEEAEHLIVVVGSHRSPVSIKNPWDSHIRMDMVLSGIHEKDHGRVDVVPIRDCIYNDNIWIVGLQNALIPYIKKQNASVVLVGHYKDDSSYYLNMFPQWKMDVQPNFFGINGTDIRDKYFSGDSSWEKLVPVRIMEKMHALAKCEEFKNLKKEYEFIQDYKKLWANAPFPPTFVTTDAVVVKAGHILLVKRKINPGKGRLALPGGFAGIDQPLFDSAIRELYEETNIVFPKPNMRRLCQETKVFDHPKRSLRGRTITHAYFFKLEEDGGLPSVSGGDDAAEAFWMALGDLPLYESNFFEDHFHIIQHFINKV